MRVISSASDIKSGTLFGMQETFFFYDLETSGINPREQRIMQFAGQRTDLSMNPIGDPFNILIKLTEDVLPDPDAILVTGITPQQTIDDGLTEVEFLKLFHKEITLPGTIFVGFNTVRFDDEFIRYLHYRNYYDAYQWHWQNGCSRWDLLDLTRMTRALRPENIMWPVDSEGKPTNRLELLTSINNLDHQNAHDALSDVRATISVAKMLNERQPRLFKYLLKMRDKNEVERLVKSGDRFVYSSGKYSGDFEKTTIAVYLADNPKSGALVYDLRFDPTPWLNMPANQLVEAWKWKKDSQEPRLPIKTLQYNRCPAVAPSAVLDDQSKQRLKFDMDEIVKHHQILSNNKKFVISVLKALEIMNKQQQLAWQADQKLVDGQLYDGFFKPIDKPKMEQIQKIDSSLINNKPPDFSDNRLNALWLLYKARNFSDKLDAQDIQQWDEYRKHKFFDGDEQSRVSKYFSRIEELANNKTQNKKQRYLLEDLKLYGESILPDLS